MSSNTPRAFTRSLINRIPFLAAQRGDTASVLAQGRIPSAQRVPALVLALAAVGVAVAPLATSGAGTAKPAVVAAAAAQPAAKAPAKTGGTTGTTNAAASKQAADSESKATAQSAPKAATKAASPYAGVSMSEVSPTASQGSQSRFHATATQWSNAAKIVQAAESMGMSPYASTVAVATSLQESKLYNLTVAVDHDSLGLFQQRPSTGWGTPSQLTDPTYAAKAFLSSLPSDYKSIPLHTAAQDVQRSFDGWLYSQWQDQAKYMVYTIMHQQ